MTFTKICELHEVPEGTMEAFFVEDVEVLVVCGSSGLHAFDGICPHEEFPLVDGGFDGTTIVCSGHGWIFNAMTGEGISAPGCRLTEYPIKIDGDTVYVDVDAVAPVGERR